MFITPVDEQNRAHVIRLKPADFQQGFIEPVKECLEEAREESRWRPVAIYVQDNLIGFAMYGWFPYRGGRLWLDRLLIDKTHQNQGYGRTALRLLINTCRKNMMTIASI